MNINEHEWSARAASLLNSLNITTFEQLVNAQLNTISSAHNCGAGTLREFAAGCLKRHLWPRWIGRGVFTFNSQQDTTGMVVLAGPFPLTERSAMEKAIALLNLGGIPWGIRQTAEGLMLYRDARGYVEMEPEE